MTAVPELGQARQQGQAWQQGQARQQGQAGLTGHGRTGHKHLSQVCPGGLEFLCQGQAGPEVNQHLWVSATGTPHGWLYLTPRLNTGTFTPKVKYRDSHSCVTLGHFRLGSNMLFVVC